MTLTETVQHQSTTFDAGPEAGPVFERVKRYILSYLGPKHPCLDVILLCASELVSNAIKHTRSGSEQLTYAWFRFQLVWTESWVRIAVEDTGSTEGHRPHVVQAALDSESGRGLLLIDALAGRWEVRPGFTFPGSHIVIAEICTESARS